MERDTSQFATQNYPSEQQGTVAPAPQPQGYDQVPGAETGYQQGQPAYDEGQPAQPQQPDHEARVQEIERQLQERIANEGRLRQQNEQMQSVFTQLQAQAQQQQENNQNAERVQAMLATADNMGNGEAQTYLRNQILQMQQQNQQSTQRAIEQERQRAQQAIKQIAIPQYADHLIKTAGLPPEARAELEALGDPDVMYRAAPQIKARYDYFNQQMQQLSGNQVQLARSNEVNALRNAGLGAVGGQTASGIGQQQLPTDPDDRAMAIYTHLQQQRGR